jgi:tRNA threonylcarbamoyl adenosine modification protein (Sua5/YciO/YrdC/YwlC family)
MIIEWDATRPKKKATTLILSILLNGGIIGYPTDTYYGLGCDLFNIKAIRRLYQAKRLESKRALSVICRDFKEISEYAVMDDFAFHVLKAHLPGPYTFILRARKIMPKLLMTDKKELGVRIPDHPVPVSLAGLVGRPIINTSARISEGAILADPRDIEKTFRGSVDLIIDGGILLSEPSTMVRLVGEKAEILRQGKGAFRGLVPEE